MNYPILTCVHRGGRIGNRGAIMIVASSFFFFFDRTPATFPPPPPPSDLLSPTNQPANHLSFFAFLVYLLCPSLPLPRQPVAIAFAVPTKLIYCRYGSNTGRLTWSVPPPNPSMLPILGHGTIILIKSLVCKNFVHGILLLIHALLTVLTFLVFYNFSIAIK